jgi:heme-degrading monooxygenase HmoA
MIVEQVEVAVLDGQERRFEAALCEVRQRVFMSAGFRGFTAAQGVELPSTYLVRVLWETPEELLTFAETRFARAWEPVQPFLTAKLRVNHFVERPNLGLNGPGVVTDLTWASEETV